MLKIDENSGYKGVRKVKKVQMGNDLYKYIY